MGSKKRPAGTIVIKGIGGRIRNKMTDEDRKTLNIPKDKKRLVIKPNKRIK